MIIQVGDVVKCTHHGTYWVFYVQRVENKSLIVFDLLTNDSNTSINHTATISFDWLSDVNVTILSSDTTPEQFTQDFPELFI